MAQTQNGPTAGTNTTNSTTFRPAFTNMCEIITLTHLCLKNVFKIFIFMFRFSYIVAISLRLTEICLRLLLRLPVGRGGVVNSPRSGFFSFVNVES